jgi:hypothetical protein
MNNDELPPLFEFDKYVNLNSFVDTPSGGGAGGGSDDVNPSLKDHLRYEHPLVQRYVHILIIAATTTSITMVLMLMMRAMLLMMTSRAMLQMILMIDDVYCHRGCMLILCCILQWEVCRLKKGKEGGEGGKGGRRIVGFC